MSLKATPSVTSSPGSAVGAMPSGSPDGPTSGPSGPAPFPVSRFRALDSDVAMPIEDTCGPLFSGSSPSAGLQWYFGEQVASNLGREWLAGVRADLEHVGYACGAADLPAASVGAPHIRQRLWWVAHSERPERRSLNRSRRDARVNRLPQGQEGTGRARSGGEDGGLADTDGRDASTERIQRSGQHGFQPEDDGAGGGLGDANHGRLEGPHALWTGQPGATWAGEYIPCGDGKARRIEPGTFPLAHGVPNRVGRLRAYGNAIVPQVAAAFCAGER